MISASFSYGGAIYVCMYCSFCHVGRAYIAKFTILLMSSNRVAIGEGRREELRGCARLEIATSELIDENPRVGLLQLFMALF